MTIIEEALERVSRATISEPVGKMCSSFKGKI